MRIGAVVRVRRPAAATWVEAGGGGTTRLGMGAPGATAAWAAATAEWADGKPVWPTVGALAVLLMAVLAAAAPNPAAAALPACRRLMLARARLA